MTPLDVVCNYTYDYIVRQGWNKLKVFQQYVELSVSLSIYICLFLYLYICLFYNTPVPAPSPSMFFAAFSPLSPKCNKNFDLKVQWNIPINALHRNSFYQHIKKKRVKSEFLGKEVKKNTKSRSPVMYELPSCLVCPLK